MSIFSLAYGLAVMFGLLALAITGIPIVAIVTATAVSLLAPIAMTLMAQAIDNAEARNQIRADLGYTTKGTRP